MSIAKDSMPPQISSSTNILMQNLYSNFAYNLTNYWSKFVKFDFWLAKIRLSFLDGGSTPNPIIYEATY